MSNGSPASFDSRRGSIEATHFGQPIVNPPGRVPLRESPASASDMPSQEWQPKVALEQLFARYHQEANAILDRQLRMMDQQRLQFEQERAMWMVKEAQIAQGHSFTPSQSISPARETPSEQNSGLWTPKRSNEGSKTQSPTGGVPVWLGPQPSQPPTRTFSGLFSSQSAAPKVPSIPPGGPVGVDENMRVTSGEALFYGRGIAGQTLPHNMDHKPSISGESVSKDLEGIQFKAHHPKPSAIEQLTSKTRSDVLDASVTNSPPSSFHVLPNPQTPPRNIRLPGHVDPTLRDAGHTPMARGSVMANIDGSTDDDDGVSTPKAEQEPPSLEPTAAKQQVPKQPSERHDSYFGGFQPPVDTSANEQTQETQVDTPDQDPELEGQLGLTNSPDNERNKTFLGQIDKRLSNMNLREVTGNSTASIHSPPSTSATALSPYDQPQTIQNLDGSPCEFPETEPAVRWRGQVHEPEIPLRIKKSENFGDAMAEIDYGKGFPGRQPPPPSGGAA